MVRVIRGFAPNPLKGLTFWKLRKKYIIHVITRNDIKQGVQRSVRSDVVLPNNLDNGKICQGLRHWRLLFNLKNNFSKPVRNDMNNNNSRSVLPSRQLNKLDCFAFARNDQKRHTENDSPKYLLTSQVYIDSSLTLRMTLKIKTAKDLSTYRLIDFKNVTNIFPFPLNPSTASTLLAINGYGFRLSSSARKQMTYKSQSHW